MLDNETKKRIDDCRNILVGKVPDPKSQVEQITIAMIYKFMYDMDLESMEMGGISTYFVGEYEKYSWSNIFNPRIGGEEMIILYGDGIDTFEVMDYEGEVLGYLSKHEVTEIMVNTQGIKKLKLI